MNFDVTRASQMLCIAPKKKGEEKKGEEKKGEEKNDITDI
jgi:hypothetical protein